MKMNVAAEKQYIAAEADCTRRAELAERTPKMTFTKAADRLPKYTFSVESELAVVGRDPEYADYDNPEGNIYRERYFMTATTPEGRVYRYGWEETAEKAETVFEFFAPPVSEWSLWRCVYGSIAYEQDGCEADQLASEMEEDLGANWRQLAPEVAFRINR